MRLLHHQGQSSASSESLAARADQLSRVEYLAILRLIEESDGTKERRLSGTVRTNYGKCFTGG
jgi:hypothetical protein